MSPFAEVIHALLHEGSVHLRQPPRLAAEEQAAVSAVLEAAYRDARREVAGVPLDFAAATAVQAATFVAWSCWFLLHRGEPAREVEAALVGPQTAASAAEHLSADLLFRHLPVVHRRARAINPGDVLTVRLEEVLRRWPLSGVLADIDEPPLSPVDLGGHPGLLLLYAERLARQRRPAWVVDGPAREYIELVFAERNLPLGG